MHAWYARLASVEEDGGQMVWSAAFSELLQAYDNACQSLLDVEPALTRALDEVDRLKISNKTLKRSLDSEMFQ